MLADLAYEQAENDLIGSSTWRGLVFIYRDTKRRDDAVCLYTIARDKSGYDLQNLNLVGVYDDLDTAVTIANIGYGISEKAWESPDNLTLPSLPLLLQSIKECEIDEK